MQEYISEILLKVEEKLSHCQWFGGKMPDINIARYYNEGLSVDIAVEKVFPEVYCWEHFGL